MVATGANASPGGGMYVSRPVNFMVADTYPDNLQEETALDAAGTLAPSARAHVTLL